MPSDFEDEDEFVSKTQLKKIMHDLQQLGAALIDLSAKELDSLQLDATLLEGIATYKRIKSREAKRRQLQYIGKLMRDVDPEPIQALLERKQAGHREQTQKHHLIEDWRDKILSNPRESVEAFLQEYPQADRQWLNNIARQHARELKANKPPVAARKLFAYIRDNIVQ